MHFPHFAFSTLLIFHTLHFPHPTFSALGTRRIPLSRNIIEPRLSGPPLSVFLDYPDFFSGPNLVMNIYKSRSRSVAISFLKLQHWKVQSNARVFALEEQKQCSRLSQLIKNIRVSSDWLRVALLLGEISLSMASVTFIHDRHVFNYKGQATRSFHEK